MNINTKAENELLEALEGIKTVLDAKRNGDDMRLTIDVQQDIENVLIKAKQAYPTVKYPLSLINGGCGTCFSNFINDMIPVYDRLTLQDEEFHKQLFALPDGTHLIEIADAKEVTGATSEETVEVHMIENSEEPVQATIIENDSTVIKAYVVADDMNKAVEVPKATAKRGRRTKR